MTAFLVYVTTNRGTPSPQVIFDCGAKPFLDEGIRRRMWPGKPHPLSAGEEADLRGGRLTLDALAAMYPAASLPGAAAAKVVLGALADG